jgi:hypothetical protein
VSDAERYWSDQVEFWDWVFGWALAVGIPAVVLLLILVGVAAWAQRNGRL